MMTNPNDPQQPGPSGQSPEFQAAPGHQQPGYAQPTHGHQPGGYPSRHEPVAKPASHVLGIIGLILGVLGIFTFGLTSLIGLILSIIGTVKHKSVVAIIGIVISSLTLVMTPCFMAIMLPALSIVRESANARNDAANMKAIYVGAIGYMDENNGEPPEKPSDLINEEHVPYRVFLSVSNDNVTVPDGSTEEIAAYLDENSEMVIYWERFDNPMVTDVIGYLELKTRAVILYGDGYTKIMTIDEAQAEIDRSNTEIEARTSEE